MSSFEKRFRMTEALARDRLKKENCGSMVCHLLSNDDETFSLLYHIVCEWCDYCDEQGDCRGIPDIQPILAKADPYANQNR